MRAPGAQRGRPRRAPARVIRIKRKGVIRVKHGETSITLAGLQALDADGPNAGIIKIHGLDDTVRIIQQAEELSQRIGHKIVPVEVMFGTYAGVMFVIDPQKD